MKKRQPAYFRIHPTDSGFGFEIGAPDNIKTPSVDILGREFILYFQRHCMEAADIGEMMSVILAAVSARDFDVLDQYPFIFRAYKGYEVVQRPAIPLAVRKRVMAVGKCAYCGSDYKLELDHIVPWSKGGTHDEANLQCLCKPCNRKKSNKL